MTSGTSVERFAELETAIEQIWGISARLGLDPFPVHFELVPAAIMYEFGAYGLPGRFTHWTHGRAYYQMKTMYDYGLSKIYELVINANPSYAFLLESNTPLQNKLVAAHVLAHSDCFKRNAYFAPTSRRMLETVGADADRFRRYEFEHGRDKVERLLDAVLSIEEHVARHPFIRRPEEQPKYPPQRPATKYDDLFREPAKTEEAKQKVEEPEEDLLQFILEHAPALEPWEQDIVASIRNEALYFQPQRMTKVLNEGWASYWHARILRELDLTDAEYEEYAQLNASVLAHSPMQLNPYFLGVKLLEDIERRWDSPTEEEQRLGRQPGQGRAKLFEVRELESDASLIRNYLTKQLVDDLDLYIYALRGNQWVVVEKDWERVRDHLVREVTEYGTPHIVAVSADHLGRRQLLLRHDSNQAELDVARAEKSLRQLYHLWRRPVHLETMQGGKWVVMTYDGQHHTTQPK